MKNLYILYFKRIFDFTAAFIGLIFLLPLFVIIAVLIKLEDGGPIFFKQERVGQNGTLFKIYKFRTMVPNAEKIGPSITKADDKRITKIGKFLRRYKLDELPQLINVLKGDMSIVGPRPEVPKYVKFFKKDFERILKYKPGITDYATLYYTKEDELLRGKTNVEDLYIKEILPQKLQLYEKYIKEASFLTDLKIIIKTLWKIFFSS